MRNLPRLPHGTQAVSHGRAIIDNVAKTFKPILGANIKKMSGSRGHAGGICLEPPAAGGADRGTAPGSSGRLWASIRSPSYFGRKPSIL